MSSIVKKLYENKIISPPKFLPTNIHYEALVGSIAYGVSGDNSDIDVIGFCMPPKEVIFPHFGGEILGFGEQKKKFKVYQQEIELKKPLEIVGLKGTKYDLNIHNIVMFFNLCMINNPNMIDCLFVPVNCITQITKIGQMVRENRKLFLHKGCWHRFKGYAYSQLHKMKSKNKTGKRKKLIEKHGYDIKNAYHVVRLLGEVQQILETGDLDLQRDKEVLKSIRRGEWTEEEIKTYFNDREKSYEKLYQDSKLRHSPDEESIKQLLMNCIEEHYGKISTAIISIGKHEEALIKIKNIIDDTLVKDIDAVLDINKKLSEIIK